tara:strand:+ start:231 stop:953 length:723 start_codon:yes stop_codon:yes gene_type:complete
MIKLKLNLPDFFKKKPTLIFNIDPKWKYIYDHYPIQSVSKFRCEWVKQQPIVRCPGFNDLYEYGYIVPMWFDLDIILDPFDKWEDQHVTLKTNVKEFVSWHWPETANIRPHLPETFFHSILKLHCPWSIKTPKNYAIIQKPVWFNYQPDYEIVPGVMNTGLIHAPTCPMFLIRTEPKTEKQTIQLRAGDPLFHIIVVERSKLNVDIRMGDKEIEEANKHYNVGVSLRFDTRKLYREQENE